MNYEKIIVELLARIQSLEEKVDMLMNDKSIESTPATHEEIVKNVVKVRTKDIREYIEAQRVDAKNNVTAHRKAYPNCLFIAQLMKLIDHGLAQTVESLRVGTIFCARA